MKNDYALGDWQTPPSLAHAVVRALRRNGFSWSRVLEPTCGVGNFIAAALDDPYTEELVGIDIQAQHIASARQRFAVCAPVAPRLLEADILTVDPASDVDWRSNGPLLVLGNPPWATNAAIGARGGTPRRAVSNTHGLSGLDAITGAANFDLAEAITLHLLTTLPHNNLIVALLMKNTVARRILMRARKLGLPISRAAMMQIDAQASFGAAVDACLLVLQLQTPAANSEFPQIAVYETLESPKPARRMGFVGDDLTPDIAAYRQIAWADGVSPVKWRQGIKHDAAEVLELALSEGTLRNRGGEIVDVEPEWVYPLIKGSMLFKGDVVDVSLRTILTQRSLADDTADLAMHAPRLWDYLEGHAEVFDRRKSRIYQGRSRYAMFGVGPYSFSEYKPAVSGLHKVARVRLVPPTAGRPAMLDDTCYFAESDGPAQAAVLTALLNSEPATELLRALTFVDAKRPITARLLRRVDLSAILARLDRRELLEDAAAALTAVGVSGIRLDDRALDAFSPAARQMALRELG